MRYLLVVLLYAGVVFADGQKKQPPQQEGGNKQDLKAENKALKEEIKRLKGEIESLKAENSALKKAAGLKKVSGCITVFEEKKGIGVVNLGSAAGLKGGEILNVMRDGRRIGKMRVVTVFDENVSNAKLIEGRAETGDDVEVWVRRLPGLEQRLAALEREVAALRKQIERLVEVLSGLKLSKEKEEAPEPPKDAEKPVVATVTMVVPRDDVVVLDVGSENGVKKGDIFEVYREGKPIAKLVIQAVIERMSRALILEKTLLPRRGDRAVRMKR
ncbi:MAG: hypothetical protein DRP82_03160 [Planctomycetota bacterium]|nr:MAG: hypothetical protein DRP82_03160 [Planctomycetota bacterium]